MACVTGRQRLSTSFAGHRPRDLSRDHAAETIVHCQAQRYPPSRLAYGPVPGSDTGGVRLLHLLHGGSYGGLLCGSPSVFLFFRNWIEGMKLYVGNLSWSVNDQGLEALFSQFGRVKSAQVMQDRDTGRSRGFGFVEMVDANEARQAIEALNDKEHEGRPLVVNEARPREERPRGGGGGGRGYGGGGGGYGGGGGGGYGRR